MRPRFEARQSCKACATKTQARLFRGHGGTVDTAAREAAGGDSVGVRFPLTAPISPAWWNSIHSSLRNCRRKDWGCDSLYGHQFSARGGTSIHASVRSSCQQWRAGAEPAVPTTFPQWMECRHGALKTRCRQRRPGANPGCGTNFAPVAGTVDAVGLNPCPDGRARAIRARRTNSRSRSLAAKHEAYTLHSQERRQMSARRGCKSLRD